MEANQVGSAGDKGVERASSSSDEDSEEEEKSHLVTITEREAGDEETAPHHLNQSN